MRRSPRPPSAASAPAAFDVDAPCSTWPLSYLLHRVRLSQTQGAAGSERSRGPLEGQAGPALNGASAPWPTDLLSTADGDGAEPARDDDDPLTDPLVSECLARRRALARLRWSWPLDEADPAGAWVEASRASQRGAE